MKVRIITSVAAACAVALGGCMGLPGTGGGATFDFDKFVNNPACGHLDTIKGITGAAGIPASLQFEATRTCAQPLPTTVTAEGSQEAINKAVDAAMAARGLMPVAPKP